MTCEHCETVNVPNPEKPGHFIWTFERLVRRLKANSIGDDALVQFVLPDGTEADVVAIYPSEDRKTLYVDLELKA